MNIRFKLACLAGVLALAGTCALLVAAGGSAAGSQQQIAFRELSYGSTFRFIDNAPTTTVHSDGYPARVSAGDQFLETNRLGQGGRRIGTDRIFCTATKAVAGTNFGGAKFMCSGTFRLPDGTLFGAAQKTSAAAGTEGAIVGGTGIYAGARGTFFSAEGRGETAHPSFSKVTVTLIE